MESTDPRNKKLIHWLEGVLGQPIVNFQSMVGDASVRRYFRVKTDSGSFVVMDASELVDCCAPFVAISDTLRLLGLNAPAILAADLPKGFILVTDFGDQTYLRSLTPANADALYQNALRSLSILQTCREVPGLVVPPFSKEFMWQEWEWHQEWFLHVLLGLQLDDQLDAIKNCYQLIVDSAANQPQVFMHRDYHSANLMLTQENDVGILDFQDAFMGPVTYDLASLLRDCYIDWPQEKVQAWVNFYLQLLQSQGLLQGVTQQEFMRWFDWMSIQRHLKALFTFSRKHVRDDQPSYLNHIPRTVNYIVQTTAQYPELMPLHQLFVNQVEPVLNKVLTACAQ